MVAALLRMGDYTSAYRDGLNALKVRRAVSGPDSSGLAFNYVNLASVCLELNDNDEATSHAEAGLEISRIFPGQVSPKAIADLYQVIGLSLYRSQEYNKSLVYCREALRIYDQVPEAVLNQEYSCTIQLPRYAADWIINGRLKIISGKDLLLLKGPEPRTSTFFI
jgi:tetratricopeptide (TPR) repeat protein